MLQKYDKYCRILNDVLLNIMQRRDLMENEKDQEKQENDQSQDSHESHENVVEEVKEKGPKPSLFGMILNPKEQFERIKNNPLILFALIIVSLISVVGTAIMSLTMNLNMLEQTIPELTMTMSEDQKLIILTIMKVFTGFMGLIMPAISILIISAIHLLVSSIAKTGVKFKQLFSMNTYIYLITAIGGTLNTILYLQFASDGNQLNFTNLSFLVTEEGVLSAVFSHIELFSIWAIILTALGLHKVAGLSKPVAWIVALFFSVIFLIFSVIGAILQHIF